MLTTVTLRPTSSFGATQNSSPASELMKTRPLFSMAWSALLGLLAVPAALLAQGATNCSCWQLVDNWSGTYSLTLTGGAPDWTINNQVSGSFLIQSNGAVTFSGWANCNITEGGNCPCNPANYNPTFTGSGALSSNATMLVQINPDCTYSLFFLEPPLNVTETDDYCYGSQLTGPATDSTSLALAYPVGDGYPNPVGFKFPLPPFPQPLSGTTNYTDLLASDCGQPEQVSISVTWSIAPTNQRPLGIDVSHFEASVQPINWATVQASNCISFAWAKATDGTQYTDPTFSFNEAGAQAAGIPIGAYHFAHPELHPGTAGADLEAAYFWSKAACYIKPGGSYLMPMLDMEQPPGAGATMASVSEWVNQWCQDVVNFAASADTVVRPVVYTDTGYAGQWLDGTVTRWIPWIAQWPLFPPDPQAAAPKSSVPWPTWALWQYATNGFLPGIVGFCDLDVLNGTYADLSTLTVSGNGQPEVFGTVEGLCIRLTWTALCGSTYRVQYTTSIVSSDWTDLAPDVTATSTTASYTDCPGGQGQRFYRVIRLN